MARWILIATTLLGLIMALLTRSPALLGLALLMTVVGLFGTVLSLAATRISANSRPDIAMLPPEALRAIRDKASSRVQSQSDRTRENAKDSDSLSNPAS